MRRRGYCASTAPEDHRRVRRAARRGGRRPDRRRVHLRPRRARLTRSAGPDPELRHDRDPPGRRGQRGAQRRVRSEAKARVVGVAGRDEAGGRMVDGARPDRRRPSASLRPQATARRPRRASSPAASTRPSSRSCESIAARDSRPDPDLRRSHRGSRPDGDRERGRAPRIRLRGRARHASRGARVCASARTGTAVARRLEIRATRAIAV